MAKQKNTGLKNAIFRYLLFIVLLSTGVFFLTRYFNRPRFVRYNGFGIDIPINYNIHGIDVSHHNDIIDWEDVKAMKDKNIRIGFSFIKATEGTSLIDERFRKNWFEAKRLGIPRGAYHFFTPGISGKAQALNFIQMVQLEKGDLPPVLDIEQINGAQPDMLKLRLHDWLNIVQKYYKMTPIIYTNADFYERFLGEGFDQYPLWVAHYKVKDKPRIDRSWIFWQHNDEGQVNGISSPVDFNVFAGDSSALKSLLKK